MPYHRNTGDEARTGDGEMIEFLIIAGPALLVGAAHAVVWTFWPEVRS